MSRVFAVLAIIALPCVAAAVDLKPSEIYTTGGQKEFKQIDSGRRVEDGKVQVERHGDAMQRLERRHDGSSNVLLVDGETAPDAVIATARVLTGFRAADEAVPPLNERSGNNWLVVFIGSGHSTPTKWLVDGVHLNGTTIRLEYRKPEARMQTGDARPYFYWVPIGALEPAAYNLELYDIDLGSVTLMRRVEVKSPSQ